MNMKLVLVLGMILLHNKLFGQSNELSKGKIDKAAETYMDPILNLVSTRLHYGNSNSALADYKKPVFGAQIGITMQAGITPVFSLVPEFYFIMKGGKLESNNPLTLGKTTSRVYSMESPLLARFHYNNFHVNAGPSIAYNFHGTNKIDGASSSTNGFKLWEAGMQFGGGYNFRIKQRRLSIDLRYNYGLTNISKTSEMYNRSLVVSVHFSKPWKTNPLGRNKNS